MTSSINELVALIAGVDEVGRGPLAGPVVAAAVILDVTKPITGLTDSKKLSAAKRELLSDIIKRDALAWAFGRAEVEEIDRLNIHHASLLAMQRAIHALPIQPDHIKVDGKFCPTVPYSIEAIIKGDLTEPMISAASIIAKVERDQEMQKMHLQYRQYGFDRHAGYPTEFHLNALKNHGICPIHRLSYGPVKQYK